MVIMGIIASIGADIVASLYQSYMKTRTIERLQSQTELVLDQIANRLQYRIKDSVIARADDGNMSNYRPLPNAGGDTFPILEWIGKDNDGFLGQHDGVMVVPGWSGFIDLDSNDTNRTAAIPLIKTRGSRLDFANDAIMALSENNVTLDAGVGKHPALIFKGKDSYDIRQYGWGNDGNNAYTYIVQRNGNDILEFIGNIPVDIYEQYDLAWSAYAIVPQGADANDFNLTLRYNYQPWENEDFNWVAGVLLVEHVSTFRFTQVGDTIRLKLCIRDAGLSNSSNDLDFAFCKEKVVY